MIGYLLTSGNRLNAFFILTGKSGGGKGTACDLISNIFGSDKVGGIQLQELTIDNRFATSHLENKQVNIMYDASTKPVTDTGLLKSITGYDDIPIEHKGKDKYMIPRDEVPDMVLACNNIPNFKNGIEEAIAQRVVLFEYKNKFRHTEKANTNLLAEILADKEEMEWLIYNGIKKYKKMITEGRDFKARASVKKTREIMGKHTEPIKHVLKMLVKYSDDDLSDEEPIIAKELNQLILFVAECDGSEINHINAQGNIPPRILASEIRNLFEIDSDWTTKSQYIQEIGESKTIYPNLYKTSEYDVWLKKMNANNQINN